MVLNRYAVSLDCVSNQVLLKLSLLSLLTQPNSTFPLNEYSPKECLSVNNP